MRNEFLDDLRHSVADITNEATAEDNAKIEREESIQYACESINELLSGTIAMEREIAMPLSRQVKELFTLWPGIIWRLYVKAIKRVTWLYLDFYRDLLTLAHVRGAVKRVMDIDSTNEISNSKRDRINRYLEGGGWWQMMENSVIISSKEALAKHQTWFRNTPDKPVIEINVIDSDDMVGATYMSIDTSGMDEKMVKEAEEILHDMAQRMAGVVQRKGYEYNVDFQWGVVKNKLNPKKLQAVVYAPIKLID